MAPLTLALITLCAFVLSTRAATYTLSDARGLGPPYAGIGGLSGGGATSRLLVDYPPQLRSQILDLLFLPNFGASLQLLKVEVGGDGQSTEGTEASHAHTIDDLNMNRGYEFMLLKEAKARNPHLGTLALSWAWPAWVGCPSGDLTSPDCDTETPYSYPQQAASYITSFVQGARDVHNISIDIASSWNEKSWSAPYLIALRAALDSAGLNTTRIVCDDWNWSCASAMMNDSALFAAVDFISGHDDMPASAKAPGKPLYDTEGFHTVGSDAGAAHWIHELSSRYVTYGQTMNIAWNLVASYYEGTAFWPHGLMHAWQPWSGWYRVPASIWATAHYSQFTSLDGSHSWHYTLVDVDVGGSGNLNGGGTYVSLVDDSTGDFTLILEKMPGAGAAAETATFSLSGRFAHAHTLSVWSTRLAVGGALASEDDQFVKLPPLNVSNNSFSINVAVGQILTITTLLSAGRKGSFPPPPPPAAFPSTYNDSFDACAIDAQAQFVTDFNGVTTCEESGDPAHGIVLRQVVPKAPIRWWADTRPHSVIGDPTWRDVDAAIAFRCTNDGGSAMIGVRSSIESATWITDGPEGIHAEDELRGLWLTVTCSGGAYGMGGAWALWPSVKDVTSPTRALVQGTLVQGIAIHTWHTLRLIVNASHAVGSIDGAQLFDADVTTAGTPDKGFVGFGTVSFGDYTQFDDIAIRATSARCSAAGGANTPVAVWPCNAASPAQRWVFGTPATSPPWAPIMLASDTSLCLTVATSKNRYGSYNLIVDTCASPPPLAQLFSFNEANRTLTTLGGADMKPEAPICVDVTAEDYSIGNALDVYPCQPVTNQQWGLMDGGLLTSGDPSQFYCAGVCAV